ncbi:hypothetical protein JK185_10270 [Gluconobacter wancherniae]|uniref:hypothetical protein n=1 Tax=Gluconobacter wancherniae TaxID=1307955 RepID=UPI001B8D254B|nr:hypothetical protein [Gluconobacter wancherniae]MBS1063427.1 hypothetical protein [Gluconobacter wancherniae]
MNDPTPPSLPPSDSEQPPSNNASLLKGSKNEVEDGPSFRGEWPEPDSNTIHNKPENFERDINAASIENAGRKEYFSLRKRWSNCLLIFIGSLLMLNALITIILLVMTAFKLVQFSDFRFIIETVLMASFLEIVGMAYIAVRFLFPGGDVKKPALATARAAAQKETPPA